MLDRIRTTGKAVTFGRVYSTGYSSKRQLIVDRNPSFEHGYSYADFYNNNFVPLHSFLLDRTQLDLGSVVYYDVHKFMEDYFLTLQLFRPENCDWESLASNYYVGDYVHSVDRAHTLAIASEQERTDLLATPHYQLCWRRICELRERIATAISLSDG
jgi:hypothetical protein